MHIGLAGGKVLGAREVRGQHCVEIMLGVNRDAPPVVNLHCYQGWQQGKSFMRPVYIPRKYV